MTRRAGMQVAGPGGRLARTSVLATCATVLALVAHAVTDGCLDVVGALVTTAGVSGAAWTLVGRRRSLPVVLGWLTAVQVAAHLTLTGLCRDVAGRGLPGGHVDGRAALMAHIAAVVFSAVVLQHADSALWSSPVMPHGFTSRVRQVLRLLTAPVVTVAPARSGYLPRHPVRLTTSRQAPPPTRRGPPRGLPSA